VAEKGVSPIPDTHPEASSGQAYAVVVGISDYHDSGIPAATTETRRNGTRMRNAHRSARILAAALAALVTGAGLAGAEETTSWAQFRGPAATDAGVGAPLPDREFGLSMAWTRELGSGYSAISIAGDRAVTQFAAGEQDVIAAFDTASGEELWRYALGESYQGHTGSDDGPLSTPAIEGDAVYALGPRGRLVALALADGSERWAHDLDESNSTAPFYGYTSSPLVTGGLVIVATGGEGHAVTAFDAVSGETRWTAGDDSVSYQTPSLVRLGRGPTRSTSFLLLAGSHQ